jgi:hypothetical protein
MTEPPGGASQANGSPRHRGGQHPFSEDQVRRTLDTESRSVSFLKSLRLDDELR